MSLKNWWRSIRKRGNSRASQAETRRRLWAHRLRPVVERLEDRLAPAVGVQPNDIRIDLNEATGNIEVYVNGSLVSADMPSSLTVNGSSDSDAFLVDFTGGGNPIPTGGLTVNGLGQTSIPGDSLTIQGGNFGTVTYTFTPDGPDGHNGNVNLGGSVVNFTGLEPITNTGDSTISIFNLPDDGVDNQAILEDDGDLNNGMVQLRSGNGTFETTTFTNPTSDTRINASDDGETLTLSRLDNGYTASVDYFGNTGNDTLVLADGASLGAGVFDGGSGIDTIDYSAYTSPVSVNLGSNTPSLTASLDSDQEVPPHTTTPTGTATITYNNVAHTFDITLTVTGISPTDPQLRFHIHRAPTGVNGPIISDLFSAPAMTSLGTLTPTGPTSFTFTATNVPLSPLDEAALLGGITYLNVHDTAFPGGEIRGQIFPGALFVAASGTATNTGGVVNVENATGGLGDDSLVGNGNANVLQGGPGNDIIVGARGADTVQGGPAAATLLAIDSAGTSLLRFSAAAPGTILGTTPITGLVGGETIAGIDFRPATGQLYGLSSQSRLYVINPFTGAATQVGSSGAFTLNGTSFGFDFNPVPDRIRVTSDADQDLRLNPNDGTLTSNDPPLAYALGDPNFGVNPNVVGSAYTNSVAGTTTTTLYDIDSNLDILAIQNPPNNGTLNTVGPLGVDTSDVVGFDIVPGSNTALATLTVGGVSSLYTINLTTGAATLVGNVGAGTVARGLAVFPDNDILVWSNGDGSDVMDGGAGSDLVNVNGAPGADDVFTIGAGPGGRVAFARTSPGPFSLDIGTVENLTVNGIGGNDTFTVNSLAGVTSLGFINLNGFDGNDTFNVLPDANVAINVTGHLPRTAPGDTLNFNANGDPVTATANSLQTPGEQPVTFAGIETINLQNTNGSIVVNGTSGPDTLVVTATGPDSGNYSLNGGPAVNFTGATQFTFNGMGGNDLLQVNNPAGGLFAPAGGIFYNGGQPNGPPGGDSLQVLGGAHTSETHTFLPDGPDGHNGTLALVNGAVTANYTYTGLEPVLVNAGTPADIVFNLPTGDGDNQAILEDNGIPGDGLSQIRSGNGTFETTTFTNPTTSLTVNTGDDGETVTVAQLDSGFAAPITVNAGAGLDTLNLDFASGNNIIPAGGIDFNGSGNDGIQLLPGYTATTVTHQYDATLGDGSIDVDGLGITYSGLSETRGISDLLAAANRVFTFTDADEDIQLTDDPTPGNGISRIHAPGETPITDYQNPTAQITVNGHQGADTFNDPTFDTVGAPPVANLNGGTGGPAGRVSDAGDTFNITPSTITTFTIDGDDPPPPATPGDSLNVNLAGTTNPFLTVLSTPDGFTGSYTFGNRQPVNFQEIETLANTVDLSITKTDGQLTDTPGTTLTYTIVVSNNGPLGVAGATVADLFPAVLSNVTFTSVAAGGATGNTAAGMGNINDTVTLPVGSSITYMATGTIDPSATGTLSNTATVTPPGGATDSNTADNSATDDTALTPVSDIQLTKADAPDPVVAGTNLTYTITVSNAGPSDAQNIQFNDAVPANTTFVSFMQTSGPAFTVTSTPPVGGTGTVTASIATLAAGASATFTFVVNVNANTPDGSTISNTATAFSGTADPNTANNSDTETTAVIAQADLAVTKTDSPDPVVAGTNLTYTLTVSNAGPSDAQNVSLSDLIPANTTFVSAMQTSGPAFTLSTPPAGGTGTFSATGATLAAGASATFTLVVNVNANTPDGSTISNTASVSSSTTDTNPANNSDTETTAVIAQADLAVTKTDSPDPVVAGTNLTYTITVSNAGPSDAQNVVLSDAVPANTTFVSFTTAAGFIRTDSTPVGGTGTITATAATLAAGASATFTLVVNVNASAPNGSTISNTASVSSSTTDTNAANDSATEPTAVIAQADLAVTKTDSPDPVVAGTNLTYTITVSNGGPSDAQSVQLSDLIPANTTFVSFTTAAGFTRTDSTPVGGTGTITATATALAAGASATFTLVVNVNASAPNGSTISNTASVSSSTTDTNPANNSDTETTAVIAQADLQVTKSDAPDPVVAGTNLTYTLTVSNAGPSDAQNVVLSDAVPANTTFVSFMQTSGPAFSPVVPPPGGTGTVSAFITTLAAGASATFTLVVKVNSSAPNGSTVTNTATASSSTTDVNPANNSDTETTAVIARADLAVTKSDSPDPVFAGDNLTYTITVSNAGPSDAQIVTLTDTVPANTTFVSFAQTSGPAFTTSTPPAGGAGTVTATGATLAAGASATFTLVVRVGPNTPDGTVITNTATAGSATTETSPANNTASQTTQVRNLGIFAVGMDAGGNGIVKVYDARTLAEKFTLTPFPGFLGAVRVAVGDVNGDGIDDVVIGAGPGAFPHVKAFDGITGAEFASLLAFAPAFKGGVFVAAGDVNGDGRADIVVGADAGAFPHVVVIDGTRLAQVQPSGQIADSALLASFLAYGAGFTGGVRVGAADVNRDGRADVITGAGPGSFPHVQVIDGTQLVLGQPGGQISPAALLASFLAYAPAFAGGVFVAGGDVNGDGRADVITGAGAAPGGHVRAVDATRLAQVQPNGQIADSALLASFFAYDSGFNGGVRVGVSDINGDGFADILTAAGPDSQTDRTVKAFNGRVFPSPQELTSFFAFPGFRGGAFIGGRKR